MSSSDVNSLTWTGPQPIFFHGFRDLENFLTKCLNVDICDMSHGGEVLWPGGITNGKIFINHLFGRLVVHYTIYANVDGAIKINQVIETRADLRSAHFTGTGCQHKRDLYKALRAWYGETQFKRLEHVFL